MGDTSQCQITDSVMLQTLLNFIHSTMCLCDVIIHKQPPMAPPESILDSLPDEIQEFLATHLKLPVPHIHALWKVLRIVVWAEGPLMVCNILPRFQDDIGECFKLGPSAKSLKD